MRMHVCVCVCMCVYVCVRVCMLTSPTLSFECRLVGYLHIAAQPRAAAAAAAAAATATVAHAVGQQSYLSTSHSCPPSFSRTTQTLCSGLPLPQPPQPCSLHPQVWLRLEEEEEEEEEVVAVVVAVVVWPIPRWLCGKVRVCVCVCVCMSV